MSFRTGTAFLFLGFGVLLGEVGVGKYAGEFLMVGIGARPLAMGGAVTAWAEDITALYWNPAGLSRLRYAQCHAMHSESFGGMMQWDFIGVGAPVGNRGGVAIGLFRLGVDDIPKTRLKDPTRALGEIYLDEQGRRVQNVPYVEAALQATDLAWVLAYGAKTKSPLDMGIGIKWIWRSLGGHTALGIGFDAGLRYSFPNGFRMGFMVRDVTTTLLAWEGGRTEVILPRVQTGVGFPFSLGPVSLTAVTEARVTFDRSMGTSIKVGSLGMEWGAGLDAQYRRFGLRTGLDGGRFTTGAGFHIGFMTIDYGFQTHSELKASHRISLILTDLQDRFRIGN